jgi:uridylate kinase
MNSNKRRILIKISGEAFSGPISSIEQIIDQLIILSNKCILGIVIGGGNIFRGLKDSNNFSIPLQRADEIGMLGTLVNGKLLQALLEKRGLKVSLLSAIEMQQISQLINQSLINILVDREECIIFSCGIGTPFFSTDTAAIVRGLQINATEIWKATKVDGIYDDDPSKNKSCKLLKNISYDEALNKKLGIMDLTAITLAQTHKAKIRVFNLFHPNSLLLALEDPNFGSSIYL